MAQNSIILRVAVFAPVPRLFDYLPPENYVAENLVVGIRVRVPFGRRELIGILLEVASSSSVSLKQLKPALEIIEQEPIFTPTTFQLIQRASDYYHHALGDVFANALPGMLRKGLPFSYGKKPTKSTLAPSVITTQNLLLNEQQQQAVTAVVAALMQFQVFLLDGVTGSGKTEVYLQIVAAALQQGKQALVLVPEIGLTPQIASRFQERFAEPIALLHSGLSDKQRLLAWLQAKEGKVRIIIGTRSAIFIPLLNPGVIIVDEEHDLSFKQQDGFRYSARDLAVVRAQLENIPILLGSATPSLETYHNAQQKKYQYLHLSERVGNAVPAQVRLLDLRNQRLENGLAPQLIASIEHHLQAGGQVLLFLNRRGFAPVLICHACGWVADCQRCDVKMTLHQHPALLQCHHCGAQRPIVKKCPICQNQQLMPMGLGTQRLEQALQQHFPDVGIVRIDRDSTRRKGSLENILQTIHQGENRILIGTQMLAKGHHFPDVSLVAVLNADNGLFSADFRASERIAQLLIQVAGRAGRAERAGEVLVQTHNPDHPLLQHIVQQNYGSFAQAALVERQSAKLPPNSYWVLLRAEATNKNYPDLFLREVSALAKTLAHHAVDILGPIPALIERKVGRYHAQLLFQAQQRPNLHRMLAEVLPRLESLPSVRRVRWSLDIDPVEII